MPPRHVDSNCPGAVRTPEATVKWAVDEVAMGPVAVLVAKMVQLKSKTSHGRVLKC